MSQSFADAFEGFVREQTPALIGMLMRLLRNLDDAGEVLQDSFLDLWGKGPGAFFPPSEPEALIRRIAQNKAFTLLRRRGRRPFVGMGDDAELVADTGPMGLDPSIVAEIGDSLRLELEALEPLEREIFTLTAEGYSSQEIGDRLGLSEANVRKLKSRARAKLRERRRQAIHSRLTACLDRQESTVVHANWHDTDDAIGAKLGIGAVEVRRTRQSAYAKIRDRARAMGLEVDRLDEVQALWAIVAGLETDHKIIAGRLGIDKQVVDRVYRSAFG